MNEHQIRRRMGMAGKETRGDAERKGERGKRGDEWEGSGRGGVEEKREKWATG